MNNSLDHPQLQAGSIRHLQEFLTHHIDQPWLVSALHPQLFSEGEMQALRMELSSLEFSSRQYGRISRHSLVLLEKLIRALNSLDIQGLRQSLKRRNALGLRQEFILAALPGNIQSLRDQTGHLQSQLAS